MEAIGLTLDAHDQVRQHVTYAGIEKIHMLSNDSLITIEPIRQLFKEFKGRQPLNAAINQERSERIQSISDVENKLAELRN